MIKKSNIRIDKLKDMCLDTSIAQNGESEAIILIPEGEVWQKLGDELAKNIKDLASVAIPIITSEEFILDKFKNYTIIALGNFSNNKLIERLYCERYTFVDLSYPGDDGYALRTIHNPFGYERNVILLGGSNLEGVAQAINALYPKIIKEKSIFVPSLIETVSVHNTSSVPDDRYRKAIRQQMEYYLTGGNSQLVFQPCLTTGIFYYQTGDERWGKLFFELFFEYFDKATDIRKGWSSMDMAEFWMWELVAIWDLVEESSSGSEEEKLAITNRLIDLAEAAMEMPFIKEIHKETVGFNHTTFNALGLLYTGRYFRKYYKLKEADKWLDTATTYFKRISNCARGWDEAGMYSLSAPAHIINYSLLTGDIKYFSSGNAKKFADYAFQVYDNDKLPVTFGDTSPYISKKYYPTSMERFGYHQSDQTIFFSCSWYYKDGKFRKLVEPTKDAFFSNTKRLSENSTISILKKLEYDMMFSRNWFRRQFACSIESVEFKEEFGLAYTAPIEKGYYDTLDEKTVPHKETFDKIAFRTSLDSNKQYLLLQGFSWGNHGHDDGNAILRFSDKGRIFLVDCGAANVAARKYHNAVIIIKDGKCFSKEISKCSKLDLCQDMDNFAFTITTSVNNNGADHSRKIIWKKEDFFVVIDSVTALETGHYDARCIWRTLGEISVADSKFVAEQKGVRFVLINPGKNERKLKEERNTFVRSGLYWENYEYSDGVVKVWRQRQSQKLQRGEEVSFLNLFYTEHSNNPRDCEIVYVDKQAVVMRVNGKSALICAGFSSKKILLEQGLFYISSEEIAGANFTRVMVENILIEADGPISAEINLKTGAGTLWTNRNIELTVKGIAIETGRRNERPNVNMSSNYIFLEKGKHRIKISDSTLLTQTKKTIEESLSKISGKTVPKEKTKSKCPDIFKTTGEFCKGENISTITVADKGTEKGFLIGTAEGKVFRTNDSGKNIWEFDAGDRIRDIACEDINNDGIFKCLIASDDKYLYTLNDKGKLCWKFKCKNGQNGSIGRVTRIQVEDINLDGEKEIIIGTGAWWVYALDKKGKELWSVQPYAYETQSIVIGDINADGRKEILVCNDYYHIWALNDRGTALWSYRLDDSVARCAALLKKGNDKIEAIAVAGSDSQLQLLSPEGKLLWKRNVGGDAKAIYCSDLDGDGRDEVIIGSDSFRISAFRLNGQICWQTELDDSIISILPLGKDILATTETSVFLITNKGEILGRKKLNACIKDIAVLSSKDKSCIVGVATADGCEFLCPKNNR